MCLEARGPQELRARLVSGAGDLFYREGINATGVNRVASELNVSKRTMYELFGSKDDLVAAALEARDARMREAFISRAEAAGDDPADQLVGLFSALESWLLAPELHGCSFLNAASELADPGHPARAICTAHKEQLRRWTQRQAKRAGVAHPAALSRQLMLLFDGSLARAVVSPPRRGEAAAAARVLVEAARSGPAAS